MNTTAIILLVLAGLIGLLLFLALFVRKEYDVRREVVIDAAQPKVFDYIRQLKNQDAFNKWVMADPDMTCNFTGTDGTPGFVYAWKSNKKSSEGEQEIKAIINDGTIQTEIRFTGPFVAVAYVDMTAEPIADNRTKVTWGNRSRMKYPMNIMVPLVEKMLAKDMDTSLGNLKRILER